MRGARVASVRRSEARVCQECGVQYEIASLLAVNLDKDGLKGLSRWEGGGWGDSPRQLLPKGPQLCSFQ